MYTCEDCGYETSRKVNFVRHRNRKNPCCKTTDGNESRSIDNKSGDLNVNDKNLKGYDQNQSVYGKNPNVNGKNDREHQCNKCKKHFSNRSNLTRHMHICKGVVESPLQCPICLKQFTSRHGKYQHRKNVQCKAVIIENEENNQTNTKQFEDVREDLIETIIKYISMYNDTKNKLGITLSEKKDRNIIKKIGYELMALDGSIPKDLFHGLEMD